MLAAAEAVQSGYLPYLRARTGEEEGHQAHKTTPSSFDEVYDLRR